MQQFSIAEPLHIKEYWSQIDASLFETNILGNNIVVGIKSKELDIITLSLQNNHLLAFWQMFSVKYSDRDGKPTKFLKFDMLTSIG